MALLVKRRLLQVVENAIRQGGWHLLHLSSPGTHPARYHMHRDDRRYRVRVYVWNLTPGGTNRPRDEWRIQVTGIDRFEPEINGKTLILGWLDDGGLVAGFDYARHDGPLGNSPSIQIREAALQQAAAGGFAPHDKGNGELGIAFKPGFLASYIEHLEALHACGQSGDEMNVLRQIDGRRDDVSDEDIALDIAEPRRFAVMSARRALRRVDFRDRVLAAYSHGCAMCGVQLDLLDGAHILPAVHPGSTDGTDNGVALCALHHRAFDRGLVTFTIPEFRIHLNEHMRDALQEQGRAGGFKAFERNLNRLLAVPRAERDRPSGRFVDTANDLRGWLF